MEDDTLPAGPEHQHGIFGGAVLHAIDGVLRGLQNWRDHIEPPPEEEPRRRRLSAALPAGESPGQVVATPQGHHGHVRSTLVFILALVLGAVGGTLLAYRGLARIVDGQEAMIDYQREQISLLEKESDRNLAAKVRYQKDFYEQEKAMRALREETQEQKERIEELEARLAAQKAASLPPARGVRSPLAAQARSAQAPQKTGTCAMSGNTANLADCIDQFNRR